MACRLFVAGATGAIGRRLMPLLLAAGHSVAGSTRSAVRAQELAAAGVEPVVVDVFDAAALADALARVRPEVVIHQLTDLPPNLDPAQMSAAVPKNARIRDEGTRNLVAAAKRAGVRRLIAQSIAWAYAPGPQPYAEDHPLDLSAQGDRGISMRGVAALEGQVSSDFPGEGLVLRYGLLYGPGTGFAEPSGQAPLHVDAAAHAAALAVGRGAPGIYNIAEERGLVTAAKARVAFGWSPDFRLD